MQSPFDKTAPTYDETFTNSKIGGLQRSIVHSYLDKAILNNGRLNILELNCGTGEDAIWFANKGHNVLATDISEEMLRTTEKKVSGYNLNDKIRTRKFDLTKLKEFSLNEKFDLIFSNFGGMNCIDLDALNSLGGFLSSFLNNRGRLLFVIMPHYCMWESIYFFIKLDFNKVFRRRKSNPLPVDLGNSVVNTNYYSPEEISQVFSKQFNIICKVPVGLFIPPSYLNPFFEKKNKLLNFLANLESMAQRLPVLSNYSDHFLIDMELKS